MLHKFVNQLKFCRDYGITGLFISLFLSIVYYRFNHSFIPGTLADFHLAYYPAGRIILENPNNLYGYLVGTPFENNLSFVNLPILAYLFTPFSLLNEHFSVALFTILGVLSVFLSGYFLIKLANVSGWKRTVLVVLLAINAPLHISLQLGNTTHFVLLLLLGSFVCFRANRDIESGVLLAVAALIKIPLLFLTVYFALKGRWQVVAAFCLLLFTVVGFSLLLFGLDLNLTWFNQCILAFSNKAIGGYNAQSLDSFLIRLLENSPVDSWIPIEIGWEFRLMRYALLSLLIAGTIWVCWYSKSPQTSAAENLEFSSFLCLALLVSPISWTHYYLFLLLPFSLYLGKQLAIPNKWNCSGLMLLSIFLVTLPPVKSVWFNNPGFTLLARAFLVPHFFWGGLLLLGLLLAARWHTSKGQKSFKEKTAGYPVHIRGGEESRQPF